VLAQSGKLTEDLQHIMVEVYPPLEESRIKELFTEINRAEPVMLIDLPEGGASADDNAKLTAAAELLRASYPAMFKPSQNCRPPHVNVDVLRTEMHRVGLVEKVRAESADELVAWLEARNAELGARSEEEWRAAGGGRAKSSAAVEKALAKARENNFYLGLGWEWLHAAEK